MTRPSWQDYGTYDESEHSRLWDGVVGAWCPSLGPTGSRLFDHSRSVNWGTLTNMDNATDWVVDGGQYALDFDGSNDHVSLPHNAIYNSMGGSFAISLWLKATGTAPVNAGVIFAKYRSAGPTQAWYISQQPTTEKLSFAIFDGSFNPTALSTMAINDSVWRHAVFVRSVSQDKLLLYVDGKLDASVTDTTTGAITNTTKPIIGSLWNSTETDIFSASTCWKGLVGDLICWNREFTANEVWDLYLLGRGGMYERRRRSRRRAIEQAAGFKAYWVRQQSRVIGGGV